MSTDRLSGIVKWFSAGKGYGFLKGPEDQDIFVHQTQIQMSGYRTLEEGQEVTFEMGEHNGRKQANKVSLVSKTELK